MSLHNRTLSAAALSACCVAVLAQGHRNPVAPGVADAGCVRYAGKYYLGGVATNGDFLISDNLVDWHSRAHVFDLDNQWTRGTGAGNDQIHADDISYSGGKFHLLFSANYWGSDRHVVHIAHAVSPTVTGPYREVRDDQWFENRIDPMVFRDDDGRLYLYMVKFTDGNTIWARPLNQDFTFAGDAVLQFGSQPGTWETMDNRVAEGPFVIRYRDRYYMMYNANHTAPEYGNYRLGVCEASTPMGFNAGGKYPAPVVQPNTVAIDDAHPDLLLYGSGGYRPVAVSRSATGVDTLRFTLASGPQGTPCLKIVQRGGCRVWLNGHAVNGSNCADFGLFPMDRQWLRKGENVVVVDRGGGTLSSLALYDFGDSVSSDLLVTPGQPNIVRGPNGWEWWLVYMANNGWERSQYVDRVHFVNGSLTVDGITGPRTEGFHPAPAMPQYSGSSLGDISFADSYLMELTFSSKAARQGISVGGVDVELPDSFDRSAAHEWRVEKNHDALKVWSDRVLIFDALPQKLQGNALKLLGDEASYSLEHVSYNEGFDEYGGRFSGWGGMPVTPSGLTLTAGTHLKGSAATGYELSVQTDDHASAVGTYGVMAAYADSRNYVSAAIDAATASLVVTQVEKGKAKVSRKPLATVADAYPDVKYSDTFEKQYRFGSDTYVTSLMFPRAKPGNDPYAHDLGIGYVATAAHVDDVAATQRLSWLDGDTWRPLAYRVVESEHPAWQRVEVDRVRTRALRLINSEPTDMHRNVYRMKVGSDRQTVNQLRVDRRGADMHVFVNGVCHATLRLPANVPTRCGLVSDGRASVTVGNALYYVVGTAK